MALALTACSAVRSPPRALEQRVHAPDRVSIAYEERGTGEPVLVFLHGWSGERAVWRPAMEAFASTHRSLALDFAGHGRSGATRTRWTLEGLADDVVAVVTAAGAEDVILIGHSMGTTVALLAAPRLAPRVRGIIGVESLHDADFAYPPGVLQGVAAALEADFPRAIEASLRGVVAPTAPPEVFEWIQARALRTDRAAAVGLLRGLEGFELAPVLRAAGVPVRVINAAPGSGTALATEVERNRRLADFDALLLDGVGHFPMLERPERFLPLLARWVEELSAPHESPPAATR